MLSSVIPVSSGVIDQELTYTGDDCCRSLIARHLRLRAGALPVAQVRLAKFPSPPTASRWQGRRTSPRFSLPYITKFLIVLLSYFSHCVRGPTAPGPKNIKRLLQGSENTADVVRRCPSGFQRTRPAAAGPGVQRPAAALCCAIRPMGRVQIGAVPVDRHGVLPIPDPTLLSCRSKNFIFGDARCSVCQNK